MPDQAKLQPCPPEKTIAETKRVDGRTGRCPAARTAAHPNAPVGRGRRSRCGRRPGSPASCAIPRRGARQQHQPRHGLPRRARRPVIFTRHVHHPAGLASGIMGWWREGKCLEGSLESEIHPGLAPMPGEKVIFTHRYSAFYNTDLETVLRCLKAEDVVIAGVMTTMGCDPTARDAYYRTTYRGRPTDLRDGLLRPGLAVVVGDMLSLPVVSASPGGPSSSVQTPPG